jgi:hypothetical protein
MSLGRHALSYAGLGMEIFPVNPRTKRPLVSQYRATTDLDQIAQWWERWPDALIGHLISPDHLLVDIDPRHGGKATWKALRAEMPEFTTRAHFSGRGDGGGHVWFRRPAGKITINTLNAWAEKRGLGEEIAAGRWHCGLDLLRSDHRYTILPPSPHPDTGEPYHWSKGRGLTTEPIVMPKLLATLVVADAGDDGDSSSGDAEPRYRDPDSPADWYSAHGRFGELLPAHGWTLVRGDGDADGSEWRHPDASNDISATVRHRCLFVYSPRTPFPVTEPDEPHGQTRFDAYAVLEHDGDKSAAASEIRRSMMPHPDGSDDPPGRSGVRSDRTPHSDGSEDPGGGSDGVSEAPPVEPVSLAQCHATFRRWLGEEYDLDALDATLATAAAEQLGGDPLWLLIVSGSGNAKTETVQSLKGAGAVVVSTLSGDAALLSGTPRKQSAKNATGGLLRSIGDRGLLVIKDVTSILSANRDVRTTLLAALREIHDGYWVRHVGSDGGKTLEWPGRIVVVGAVTTAWDRAHEVVASMGDRFLTIRTDRDAGAWRLARRNVNHEEEMRAELATAVAGVLAGMDHDPGDITDDEAELLGAAAELVTLARTPAMSNYLGDVEDVHAPEAPTRLMKQLVQIMRGAVAVGMDRERALRLAIRCARDSLTPPLRLAIIDDIAAHPASNVHAVAKRLDKPRKTVERAIDALHYLGVLTQGEMPKAGGEGTVEVYSLSAAVNPDAIAIARN